MFEEEILVTPGFKFGVVMTAKGVKRLPAGFVEMNGILLKPIVGREVHTAAKPPDVLIARLDRLGNKRTHVHVHRRDIGVNGVQHQGHADGLKAPPGKLRPSSSGRCRKVITAHMREAHATPFKQASALNQPRAPIATQGRISGLDPGVFRKGLAIGLGNRLTDAILKA